MSNEVVHYRFLVRGGTAANLAAVNEVPLRRELVVALDTGTLKVGDGVTPYNDLPFLGGGGGGGGSAWHSGAGAPSASLGTDGDYYLDTASGGVYAKESGAWILGGNIKGPQGLKGDAGPPGPASSCFPTVSIDGGSGDIGVGAWAEVYVPFGFDITAWTLVANSIGILAVDVRVYPLGSATPTAADSICGGAVPALDAHRYARNVSLPTWNTEITSGSVIRFVVTASSGVRRATLTLEGVRS